MFAKVLTALVIFALLIQWIFATALSIRRGGTPAHPVGPPWTGWALGSVEAVILLAFLRIIPGLRGAAAIPLGLVFFWGHRALRRRLDAWLIGRGWVEAAVVKPRRRKGEAGATAAQDAANRMEAAGLSRLYLVIFAVGAGVVGAAALVHFLLGR